MGFQGSACAREKASVNQQRTDRSGSHNSRYLHSGSTESGELLSQTIPRAGPGGFPELDQGVLPH